MGRVDVVVRPARAEGRLPARQASLRSMNLATVLDRVCASTEPPSRADVSAATGLTRSTVSRLVDELVEQHLVSELDPLIVGTRGRPAVPLIPAAGTWVGLGLEINVTHLAARLVDLAGNALGERYVAADLSGSPREIVERVALLGRELLAAAPDGAILAGVHLAVPGLVEKDEGVVLRAPNLGWWDVRPLGWLTDALGVPLDAAGLGNEADFAAVTVARSAPGRRGDADEFLFVSGEVGVGAAIVRSGDVFSGLHGWAGEIGHICVDPAGPDCACGATGCLERYVGQRALCDAAGVPDRESLAAALDAGEPRAVDAVVRASHHLGIVLAGALNLLDLPRVVLGGHLGAVSEHLLPGVQEELTRRVISSPFSAPALDTVIRDADTAALGAAYASLLGVLNDPVASLEAPRVSCDF